MAFQTSTTGQSSGDGFQIQTVTDGTTYLWNYENKDTVIGTNGAERMRLDASGNVLVNTTSSTTVGNGGFAIKPQTGNGTRVDISNAGQAMLLDGAASGPIIGLYGNGTPVGSIGTAGDTPYISAPSAGGVRFTYLNSTNAAMMPCNTTGANADATHDIGYTNVRFKDLYLSGGVFLGGTGAANKLEDYESGGYNATFTTQNGSINLNGTQNRMNYTKIGRKVTITGRVVVASVSNPSGYIRFSLPFTNVSESEDEGHTALNVITYNVSGIGSNVLFAEVGPNTAYGILLKSVENSGWSYLNANGFSANDIIYMNGTYLTDA
jgi:hypothetical protein